MDDYPRSRQHIRFDMIRENAMVFRVVGVLCTFRLG